MPVNFFLSCSGDGFFIFAYADISPDRLHKGIPSRCAPVAVIADGTFLAELLVIFFCCIKFFKRPNAGNDRPIEYF